MSHNGKNICCYVKLCTGTLKVVPGKVFAFCSCIRTQEEEVVPFLVYLPHPITFAEMNRF